MLALGSRNRSRELPKDLASQALTPQQADRLSAVVEALKLRLCISVAGARALRGQLGVGAGAHDPEEAECEEQEPPTPLGPPPPLHSLDSVPSVETPEPPSVSTRGSGRAEPAVCSADEFRRQLLQELRPPPGRQDAGELGASGAGGGPSPRLTELLYHELCASSAARLREIHEEIVGDAIAACLGPVDTGQGLVEALEAELDRLLWERKEVELVFHAWLSGAEQLCESLTQARVQIAARKAQEAFRGDKLAADDVLALARAFEDHHRALAGGAGPVLLGAPGVEASVAAHRERQLEAHLLHTVLAKSREWLPLRSKGTMSRRWAGRAAAALLHRSFHAALLALAEGAAEGGAGAPEAAGALEAVREALRDFRPLKYDKDCNFLLYFSGRLGRLLARPPRPVAVVLTSSHGAGYCSAARGLEASLSGKGLEVHVVDLSRDAGSLEFELVGQLRQRAGPPENKQCTAFEDLLARRQLAGAASGAGKEPGAALDDPDDTGKADGGRSGIAGPIRSPDHDSIFKRMLRGHFLSLRPALVVTVYHADLNPILALCEELGSLPLIHLSPGLEARIWEVFGRAAPIYPKFSAGVPFDVPLSWETLFPLSTHQVFLAGYPVRPEFLRPAPTRAEWEALRRRRGLREDEHVVLAMVGHGAQEAAWPQLLASSAAWGLTCSARDVLPRPPRGPADPRAAGRADSGGSSPRSPGARDGPARACAGGPAGLPPGPAAGPAGAAQQSGRLGLLGGAAGRGDSQVPAVPQAPGREDSGAGPPSPSSTHTEDKRSSASGDGLGHRGARACEEVAWTDPRLRVVVVAGKSTQQARRAERDLGIPAGASRPAGSNALVAVEIACDPGGYGGGSTVLGAGELADLMDVASAAIVRPSGSAVFELVYRGVPMVLDLPRGASATEEFAAQRLEEAGRGVVLRGKAPGALEAALRRALALGRDQALAADGSGALLQTCERLLRRAAALSGQAFLGEREAAPPAKAAPPLAFVLPRQQSFGSQAAPASLAAAPRQPPQASGDLPPTWQGPAPVAAAGAPPRVPSAPPHRNSEPAASSRAEVPIVKASSCFQVI
ncbi:unnamed protein product [Prorocentrum cordatum]|uniref:Glycosyl transferase family 28 C-terminal domain-containing protein n=1 Tax=Prorocentrum cordatum TaxID=2364126 RepID=A0ABN9X9F8_9DINO|nr:unnamed protein product [Polarella glacialis]